MVDRIIRCSGATNCAVTDTCFATLTCVIGTLYRALTKGAVTIFSESEVEGKAEYEEDRGQCHID